MIIKHKLQLIVHKMVNYYGLYVKINYQLIHF